MHSSMFSLVVFTLLFQLSIGLVILFNSFIYWPLFNNRSKIQAMLKTIPSIALSLSIIGALIYFLHPGHPIGTIRDIHLFQASWLEWELVLTIAYLGLLILFIIFTLANTGWKRFQKILLDLTSIAGIVLVYIMARVYMTTSQPNWNSWYTVLSFAGSTLIMGAPFLLLIIARNGSYSSQKGLAWLTILMLILSIAVLPLFMGFLLQNDESGRLALDMMLSDKAWLFFGRILFQIVGLLLILRSLFVIRSDIDQCRSLIIPVMIALISIFVAQAFERILFFTIGFPLTGI